MKKTAILVTQSNLSKFIDTVASTNVKPIISISNEGFFETSTNVWFVMNDEQIEAFKNNGFTVKTV